MNKSFLLIASYFFLVVHLGTVITQRSQDESSHQYVHLAGNGHSIKKATLDNDIPEGEILTKKQSFLQNNTLAAGSPPPPCVGNDCFCQNFYDLTLIIDESASIGIQNWGKHVIPFTDKIIKDLHISKNEVHVGILLFSNFIRDYVTFDKDESYKKDELLKKVDELKKKYGAGGGTKIVSALDYALEKYTHHKKGRPNAPKVTILFTDGNDTSPGSSTRLLDMGLTYRKQNVKLLVLGVAAAKDVNLREIAGCGEKNAPCPNAMKAEWETINDITKKLTNKICHTEEEDEDIITATTPPQQNTCQGDDCFCEDYYDLTLILDESGSITLNKWKIDVVPFAEKVVSNLNISKDKIHVGIMRFAVKVKEDVSYGQETRYDKNALINVVTGLRDKYGAGQGTRLVDALKHALTNFTRHPNNRPNAPKVTILFTDGNENYRGSNDVRDIGLKYRKENVRLIVVGVYKATIKSLKMLAGCNENENCPQVIKCDWDQLTSITEVITDKICDIDAGGNLPGLTDGSQNPGGAEKPGSSEKPDGTEKPGSSEKPDGTEKPGSSEKPDGTEKPGSGGPSEPEQQHPPCADWDDCYCKHFYDLTLVLDESASIGNFRWSHEVVPFATEIVKSLHVGYDAVHVGLFLFADSRRDIVRFSDATRYDKSFLLQKIESLKGDYRNGKKTYIVQALVYALMSYTKSSSRVNAPKVTMIFTDGNDSSESDERLYKTGLLYRREKVKLLVLGVSMADENRLRLLVGCMRSANCPFVIKAEWGQLPSMSNEFVRRICSSGPVIPPEVGNSPPPPPPEVVNPTDPEPVVPPCQGDECLCQSMYDLTLILDESGSIGNSNWKKQVYPFVEKIVNNLEVSESKVHVGIMLFAKKMRDFVKFSEKESYEKDSLMRKVPELKGTYKAGTHTYIVESLEYGLQHYTKGPNSRADMPKVTILFTDGNESKSGDEILSNVSSLYKKENVKLLVVGVGAASMPKLRLLGGCHKTEGDCPFAIKTEWNSLKDISQGMVDKICNTDTEIIPPPPSSGGAEVTPPSCTGEECFCKDYYDLTFIGAPSTNNNSRRKNELMEYVTRIVNSFNVGEKNVHVSLSLHLGAKMVNTDFGNAVARDKKELLSALEVMSAEYVNLGRKTNIAEALTVGLKQSFSTGHREDAPKIAVLLTDSNNDESEQGMLQSVSKQYADKKVKLLVVGIGKLPEELLFITAGCALSSSGGDHRKDQICPNVFISSRFSYINSVEKFLSGNICDNGAGGGAAVVPPPSSSLPPPNVPCQNDESCAECDDDVCNNDPTCKKVFDIAIVVDQSSSITNDQWKKYVRPFSINVIKSNYLAKNRTHVTMVKMGRTAKVLWELGRKVSYKKNQMIKKVNRLVKSSSCRKDIASNLKHIREKVFSKNTSSNTPNGRKKLIIMLVEGKSDADLNELRREVALLKVNNIDLFVYAIDNIDDKEYRILGDCEHTSSGVCKNAVKVKWDKLLSSEEIHSRYICNQYPADAECAEWGDWSPCPDNTSSTCNNLAVSKRERKGPPYTLKDEEYVDDGRHLHGSSCTDLNSIEYRACPPTAECNDACGDFGEWSQCNATCGDGIRTRHRAGAGGASADGIPLAVAFKDNQADSCQLFNATEVESCNVQDCDSSEICEEVGEWGDWSPCSKACGYSTKRRTFVILPEDINEYAHCSTFEKSETEICSVPACEDEKCFEWEEWTEWSATCGPRKRVQRARQNPDSQTHECEVFYENKVEHDDGSNGVPCTDNPCGSWSEWSECDRTCNVGMRMRRFISNVTGFVGDDVGLCLEYHNEIETEPCLDLPPCDAGECNDWETWVGCGDEEHAASQPATSSRAADAWAWGGSTSCHAAPRRRILTRKLELLQNKKASTSNFCSDYKLFREEECPVLGGATPCNDALCNEWEDWGECSTTCGPESFRVRRRKEPLELIPPSEDIDGKMGLTCEQQNIRIEEREACSVPACALPSGGADSGSGSGSGSSGSGEGMGTGEKVSLAAGILGLAALGVGGLIYGYKTLNGGETPHSSNMEFENVEAEGAVAEKSNEDFEVIDANDPMWN